ncbi:MAG: helix-turn-helix domain-containing protein [Porticoccaceae bacterium]
MITMDESRLSELLAEAARRGAEQAISDLTMYTKQQACEMLGISYNTLQRRIVERKIRIVDGRIPGEAIRQYLSERGRNV